MRSIAIFSVLVAVTPLAIFGQPTPLTPPAGEVGTNCEILWTPDSTGQWTQTNIELMTGSNPSMIHVTTVATLDTTTNAPSTFTYPCPNVTPNSDIYWYQFSHATEPTNLIWTTRFPLEGTNGALTPPQYSVQPDNTTQVPWGIGSLVDPSLAKAAPAYITGETSATGSTNGTMASASVSLSVSTVSASTTSASTSGFLTSSAVPTTTTSIKPVTTVASSVSVSKPTSTTSGALRFQPPSLVAVAVFVLLGHIAFS